MRPIPSVTSCGPPSPSKEAFQPKSRRKIGINDKNRGGLNLRDLESAIHKFKVSSALRFLKNEGLPLPCTIM